MRIHIYTLAKLLVFGLLFYQVWSLQSQINTQAIELGHIVQFLQQLSVPVGR